MIYNVFYSAEARNDLRGIYEYIAYKLLEPKIAASQTKRIMEAVCSLKEMPMRHRLYEEEPWRTYGLRFMPVDNYLIFYLVNETTKVVNIIRVIYGGRNIKTCLQS